MARTSSKPRRNAPPPQPRWKAGLPWRGLFKLALLLGIWGGIAGVCVIGWYAVQLPKLIDTAALTRKPSITILAEDGSLIARYGEITGALVDVKHLPPHLINAVLSVEDRRFYSHFGIDPLGLLRAFWVNYHAGRVVQGGSTITQQLAKNLFLSSERSMHRKVQEALLALWLDWKFSKDEILTAYLNRVYLGAGAYGVDAAARVYYNKTAAELTLKESAIIAGLLRAPSTYAPTNNPQAAEARGKVVISTMVDAGMLSEADAAKVFSKDAGNTSRKPAGTNDYARYFADWIMSEAEGYIGDDHGDIVVQTTLRPNIQRAAESAIATQLAAADKDGKRVSEAAAIVLSPDGAVRAMVGGRDWGDSQFNRAVQALRQPGSSFKPVIYLTALMENGYRQNTLVEDAPIAIGNYSPDNYTGSYKGWIPLSDALANSLNTVAVRLLQEEGLKAAQATARKMGLPTPKDAGLSYALGTSEVTLLQLTSAYATLQTGGLAVRPYAIHMIRARDGSLLWQREAPAPDQVLPRENVADLVDMMKGVVAFGTGTAAKLDDRPVAGKTGTSQSFRDAWFMGFTADYIGGIWMGNDDNKPMKKVTGGSYPARAWKSMMQTAEAGLPISALPTDAYLRPADVAAPTEDDALSEAGLVPSPSEGDGDFMSVLHSLSDSVPSGE